jgi:hypothetical protein
MRIGDRRSRPPTIPALVGERIRSNKTFLTIAGTAFCLLVIAGDALLLSGTVVRTGCGLVPQGWHERLPCPASRAADSGRPRSFFEETGIVRSEPNFWAAVARGDRETTLKFLSDGMTISSLGLHEVLSDALLTKKAPLDVLLRFAEGRNEEFCSSDDANGPAIEPAAAHRTIVRFAQYAKDPVAVNFLRKFCPTVSFSSALKKHLVIVTERLAVAKARNARNSSGLAACTARILTKDFACRASDSSPVCRAIQDFFARKVCPQGAWNCWPDKYAPEESAVAAFCRERFVVTKETDEARKMLAASVEVLP